MSLKSNNNLGSELFDETIILHVIMFDELRFKKII